MPQSKKRSSASRTVPYGLPEMRGDRHQAPRGAPVATLSIEAQEPRTPGAPVTGTGTTAIGKTILKLKIWVLGALYYGRGTRH